MMVVNPFILGSFSPLSIANCQLWLDANQINGLSNGDPVGTWSDLSGNANHLTQATAGSKPLYDTSGGAGVLFDGTDDWLENLTFTGGYTPEIFIRLSVLTYAMYGLVISNPDNGYNAGTYQFGTGNFGVLDSAGGGLVSRAFALNTIGVVRVYWARDVGSNASKFAVDGAESDFTCTAGTYIATTFDKINLGRFPASNHYQNAKVRQVLVYSSPLTADQRLDVESYLAALP